VFKAKVKEILIALTQNLKMYMLHVQERLSVCEIFRDIVLIKKTDKHEIEVNPGK